MSKLIKQPIFIPKGITLSNFNNKYLIIQNPAKNVSLKFKIDQPGFNSIAKVDEMRIKIDALGTYYRQVSRIISDVYKTFIMNLQITGVGYQASILRNYMVLRLGYSHKIFLKMEENVIQIAERKKRPIVLQFKSVDRHQLTQLTSILMRFRPQEPYKGKGIHHVNSAIRLKEGKNDKK